MQPTASCTYLDWDSDFFGVRIARVNAGHLAEETVAPILAWCADQAIDCLYFLADADDYATSRLAAQNDFYLVDLRVSLDRALVNGSTNGGSSDGNGSVIRPCEAADLPALKAIARTVHRDTRFYFDPRFPRDRCDALYETWIEKSCDGYADLVLVADLHGAAVGYCSCHRRGGEGQIGLFGVHADHHGQGVGSKLIREALGWFVEQGLERASVVTQGRNIAAQRLYQKHGFMTRAVQMWYHRWFTVR